MRSHTPARKRLIASVGALTMAAATVFAMAPGNAAQTDAAWTDSEYARADLTARWTTEYYSTNVYYSQRTSNQVVSGDNLPYYRSTLQNMSSNNRVNSTTSFTGGQPRKTATRQEYDYRFNYAPGTFNDSSPYAIVQDDNSWEFHQSHGFNNGQAQGSPAYPDVSTTTRCIFGTADLAPAPAGTTACGAQPGDLTAARNNGANGGFSISITGSNTQVMGYQLSTAVRCSEKGAYASTPTGKIDIGPERLSANGRGYVINYSWPVVSDPSRGWITVYNGNSGDTQLSASREVASSRFARWRVVPRTIVQQNPPYAFSSLELYVESMLPPSGGQQQINAKTYFVLSRSECGVNNGYGLPPAQPLYPAMPGGEGFTPATDADFTMPGVTPSLNALRMQAQPPEPTTSTEASDTSEATTTTSPTETTTATTVTTSAPPPDSTTDEASTTQETTDEATTTEETTTAPDVPSEPAPLGADDQVVLVGNVTIDDAFEDAWVKGNTEPDDANDGVFAIDGWINSGIQTDRDWEVFESDDPSADGWRYAAISQITGTVVYVK